LPTATQCEPRRQNLSAYDAAYLELAIRERLPLATLDEDVRKAARVAGVKIATAK
jgi:predicted nucleic acid-binding protein